MQPLQRHAPLLQHSSAGCSGGALPPWPHSCRQRPPRLSQMLQQQQQNKHQQQHTAFLHSQQQHQQQQQRPPRLRSRVVVAAAAGPCSHPLAAAAGGSWAGRRSAWLPPPPQLPPLLQQQQQQPLCSSAAQQPLHGGHRRRQHCRAGPPTRHASSGAAARLPPPGASLALVEPAVAGGGGAAALALGGSSAGVAAGLSAPRLLAVVLGYCVMVGSLFRSVPQIIKVVKHNSTEGLSLTSYLVELCCYTVVIAYNVAQGYQFNTFGEVVACWVQDVILIALVCRDRATPNWLVAAGGAAFAVGAGFLLSPACPPALLASLQASNIAVMALGSRLPQILLNVRRGNAGMLSVTTCLLNVAGNTARIFTTLVLTGDLLMLGGACSQGCLNAILLYQSVSTARSRRRAAAAEAAAALNANKPSSRGLNPGASAGGSSSSSSGPMPPLRQRPEPEAPPGGFSALQPAT